MTPQQPSICFATMAVGHEYRRLADLLIEDITLLCPGTQIVVLSDDASYGEARSGVTTVPFRHPGFWYLYYGKLQAIRAALQGYDVCVFLDADCRLLGPPPIDEFRELPPGAYGAYTQPFPHKFAGDHRMFIERGGKERWLRNSPHRQLRLYSALGEQLGVRSQDCVFLHESCLIVVKNESTPGLFAAWEYLGRAASSRLLEWGEGCTLGMALRLVDLNSGVAPRVQQWLFKDLLLSQQDKDRPELVQLLADRRSLSPAKPNPWAKFVRFAAGLLRYLRSAPLWLVHVERRERARLIQMVS